MPKVSYKDLEFIQKTLKKVIKQVPHLIGGIEMHMDVNKAINIINNEYLEIKPIYKPIKNNKKCKQ
jgi:hypothetical protein